MFMIVGKKRLTARETLIRLCMGSLYILVGRNAYECLGSHYSCVLAPFVNLRKSNHTYDHLAHNTQERISSHKFIYEM